MIRRARLLFACLAAALAACGGDDAPAQHGLQRETIESRPTGAEVAVRYAAPDRARYRGRVTIAMRFKHVQSDGDGAPKVRSGEGTAVATIHHTFFRGGTKRVARSEITFDYVDPNGVERATVSGTLEHDADGRVVPRSLRLTGGTKAEQVDIENLVGTLLLAGFGGAPSWMPPRPVRVGEAWQLEGFVTPRSLERMALQARRVGLEVPRPTFSGTARLEKVREGADGPELEVSLDALFELEGPIRKDGREGRVSFGDRMRGSAVISAATGLPLSFHVTHTGRQRVRTGAERIEQDFTSEVEGRVERLDGR